MAIIQDLQSNGFTVVGNKMIRDRELSLSAKGLLLLCLSLPKDWKYNITGLASMCRESRKTVGSYMRELEKAGYVIRHMERNASNTGYGGCSYTIVNAASAETAAYEPDHKVKSKKVKEQNSESEGQKGSKHHPLKRHELVQNDPTQDNSLLNTYIPIKELLNTNTPSTYQVKQTETYRREEENVSDHNVGNHDREQPVRHRYGRYENVLLSEMEYSTLMHEFPSDYKERIENLSEYMASTGRLYESHLATIQSWNRLDKKRGKKSDYSSGYSHSRYEYKGDSL